MTTKWRSLLLAIAVGAAGGLIVGAGFFSTPSDHVAVTSTRQASPSARGLDPRSELDSARREIASLRSRVEAGRQRIEDLTAKLDGQTASEPQDEAASAASNFRSELRMLVKWVSEPLTLESITPEQQGVKAATASGGGNDQHFATRLSDADFARFIVSLARSKVQHIERAIGRPITDMQRVGIEQALERNWTAFRKWRGTTFLKKVRSAESQQALNMLLREHGTKKVSVLGRIIHDVSNLFRETEADRAIRERVLLYF